MLGLCLVACRQASLRFGIFGAGIFSQIWKLYAIKIKDESSAEFAKSNAVHCSLFLSKMQKQTYQNEVTSSSAMFPEARTQ